MATVEAKAVRRAIALNELDRLSGLLAEAFKIELGDLRPTHKDPELQTILRVEAINGLLGEVLKASGVETETAETGETETDEAETDAEPDIKHMKKAELLEYAKSKGLDVDNSFTMAEIIEELER